MIKFLYVDLFCGFGGTTTGIHTAKVNGQNIAKVIACVNHDPKAIKSHFLNYPDVVHFEEDIRTLDITGLTALVTQQRALYPGALVVLWASLECTNFSKAKGGQARDADSRTLADHLPRYQKAINPDYIQIENVVEFMSWGPLDENGKPLSRKNGSDWLRWRNEIKSLGYKDDWKELNSANYGAYTSRNRLFGCFARPHLPIVWPEPTHSKNPTSNGMFEGLKKWKAVKDVLDFSDEGQSIFSRTKELSEKTLERIYAGLVKFVAGGEKNFMLQTYAANSKGHNTFSTEKPARTVTTRESSQLVKANFLVKNYSGSPADKVIATDQPAPTVTTIPHESLVQSFLVQRNGGNPERKIVDVNGPARTLTTTGGNQDLVQPEFIAAYYGNGDNCTSVQQPCPTVVTKDRFSLVQPVSLLKYDSTDKTGKHYPPSLDNPAPVIITQSRLGLIQAEFMVNYNHSSQCADINEPSPTLLTHDKLALAKPEFFIDRQFGGGANNHSSIDMPVGSLLPIPKTNLVEAVPFIMPTAYNNMPKDINEPCPTLTASRRHHYIINPSHGGNCTSSELPCPVIVARQDKAPLSVAEAVESGSQFAIIIFDTDSEIMVKIKRFMAAYSIIDIKMRMLRVSELLKIQGFSEYYKMVGNQSDQKKFIGNSVVPKVPECWILAMYDSFTELQMRA